MTQAEGNGGMKSAKKIWVTSSGVPLTFTLQWPFHPSTSGADFWVLHGDIRLEHLEGLHCPVAVNLSQTVREVMPSMEPKDAESPVINALRKEVDRRQIEFLKSGKLLPVSFSSRYYDFKRMQWVFGKASDDAILEFLARKIYWQTKLGAGGDAVAKVWIADPTEAQYLQTTTDHLLELATKAAAQGSLRLDGDWAEPTARLMDQAERFETAMRQALEELDKKHAFERA
jgi:hypothetical protein